jgi:hypothetical protein
MITSRLQIAQQDTSEYLTSESPEGSKHWLQPSASHYLLITSGNTLRGQLVSTIQIHLAQMSSAAIYPAGLSLDQKDALMDDAEVLRAMYSEFSQEDRELAAVGLSHYAEVLAREESGT